MRGGGRPCPIAGTSLRTALGRGTGAPPPRTRAPPGQASGTGKALVRFLLHRKTSYTLFRNEGASSCRNFMESTARNSRRPRVFLLPRQARPSQRAAWNQLRPSALTPYKGQTNSLRRVQNRLPKWSNDQNRCAYETAAFALRSLGRTSGRQVVGRRTVPPYNRPDHVPLPRPLPTEPDVGPTRTGGN